jgi:hypothetical protein
MSDPFTTPEYIALIDSTPANLLSASNESSTLFRTSVSSSVVIAKRNSKTPEFSTPKFSGKWFCFNSAEVTLTDLLTANSLFTHSVEITSKKVKSNVLKMVMIECFNFIIELEVRIQEKILIVKYN